jgi:proton-translocating NADH-quinone oxidoreductase chain M
MFAIFLLLSTTILILFFLDNSRATKQFALSSAGFILALSCFLTVTFDSTSPYFQHLIAYPLGLTETNILYAFGLDGLSLFFFLLSALLIFLCIIFIWDDPFFKEYTINLFLIELFLLLIFSALDLFIFYVFFEAILIPMFVIIGFWGSRERKIRAVYLFFFYTLCGSILMLISILYILGEVGSLNLEYLYAWEFSKKEQIFLWLTFFLSFASKIPLFPFHIWLPEAHVEAPTVGSVLLAGILLKLGVYGFLRFSLPLFPEASLYFAPLVYLLAVLGVVYASLAAICQTDLKRIIAYSSVAHMNMVMLGIFSFNVIGVEGAILQSLSHGFVAGGLFFLIGILYDRYHSRFIYYYGGVVYMMPVFSAIFLLFTLANIALPGTSSFVGEFLLLTGIFKNNIVACVISATGVVLSGAYSLWLYNRIIFCNLKINYTIAFSDITKRELVVVLPLLFFILLIGIYPTIFTDYFHGWALKFLG